MRYSAVILGFLGGASLGPLGAVAGAVSTEESAKLVLILLDNMNIVMKLIDPGTNGIQPVVDNANKVLSDGQDCIRWLKDNFPLIVGIALMALNYNYIKIM